MRCSEEGTLQYCAPTVRGVGLCRLVAVATWSPTHTVCSAVAPRPLLLRKKALSFFRLGAVARPTGCGEHNAKNSMDAGQQALGMPAVPDTSKVRIRAFEAAGYDRDDLARLGEQGHCREELRGASCKLVCSLLNPHPSASIQHPDVCGHPCFLRLLQQSYR